MEREGEKSHPVGDGSPDEGWDELMRLDVPPAARRSPRDAARGETSSPEDEPRILCGDALKAWFLERMEQARALAPEEAVVFGIEGPRCSRAVVVFPRALPFDVLEQAMGEIFGVPPGGFSLLAMGHTLPGREDWCSFIEGTVVRINPRMPRWVVSHSDLRAWEAHIADLPSVIREEPVCVGM